jgi:hypothetical protein
MYSTQVHLCIVPDDSRSERFDAKLSQGRAESSSWEIQCSARLDSSARIFFVAVKEASGKYEIQIPQRFLPHLLMYWSRPSSEKRIA